MDHKRCEYCSEITAPLFVNEEGHLVCTECHIDWNYSNDEEYKEEYEFQKFFDEYEPSFDDEADIG